VQLGVPLHQAGLRRSVNLHTQRPYDPAMAAPLLVVSPHLDDAVLSAGATIAAARAQVVVCTVFAGLPEPPLSTPAREFHAVCGLGDDAVAVRRAEDRAALALLGAEALHWDFLDGIYRRRGAGWLIERLGSHLDVATDFEPELADAIASALRELVRSLRPSAVWTCAAIGDHVDHRVVLAASRAACAAEDVALCLWEDLPYAVGRPAPSVGAPLAAEPAGPAGLAAKLDAIGCYGSQLGMLFGDEDWRVTFEEHARGRRRSHGAPELIWAAAAP
jgi:LmbE family N-acetylglucosaminyl deacetylase